MRSALLISAVLLAAATPAWTAGEGKALYETKCAQCHGKDGVAKPPGKGSRNFNDAAFQASATEASISTITADGKGKMPPYRAKLSEEQIRAVAAHVKTLGSP